MKDIKTLLLQGGLEVISEIEEQKSLMSDSVTGYRLNRPYRILPVPLPMQGPKGVVINITPQMVPLIASTIQNSIDIKTSDIIGVPMDVSKEFASAYIQRTTGLQLAP